MLTVWRIWRDCGEWLVSEISHAYANWETYSSEERAIGELRRLQTNDLLAAEKDLEIAKRRVEEKRAILLAPPKVSRMDRSAKATEKT